MILRFRVCLLFLFAYQHSINVVSPVNRGNFKTCDQSGFCKRNRMFTNWKERPDYSVVITSITQGDGGIGEVGFDLTNKRPTGVVLHTSLTCIRGDTVRVRVTERNPPRDRYETEGALDGEPEQTSAKVEHASDGLRVTCGSSGVVSAVVTYNPFRIDLMRGEQSLVVLNEKRLLRYEQYRTKPDTNRDVEVEEGGEGGDQGVEGGEQGGEGEEVKNEEGMEKTLWEEQSQWDEHFQSHHDSKPFGPSSVGLDICFPTFSNVYGIPEHADHFRLEDTIKDGGDPYRLYNLDVFEYELHNRMALYGSVPYLVAHNTNNTVGVYWNNGAETWVDIKYEESGVGSKIASFFSTSSTPHPSTLTHWMSESGVIDLFVLLGATPRQQSLQYSRLTGFPALPPLFSIAYHQCRWNYMDEKDVRQVNDQFENHNIPLDVIWLDIEHTDGKRYFTWDQHKFPTSQEMISYVASHGRKMVTIIDPHLKVDSGYEVYAQARDQGLLVKKPDGTTDYEGWCWPGSSAWLDFTLPQARDYWASRLSHHLYTGSTPDLYTWNDMNEPSVFNGPEVTMHKDARHTTNKWEHRDVHNLYGMLVHNATARGQLERSQGTLRPFVLSRAFFAGTQRIAGGGAVWTGDNLADWSHLAITAPMLLSLSVAGIPFVGADVGGFFKNPSSELMVRWYQAGAFQPFFRAHAHLDTKRREPWMFGDAELRLIRDAVRQRYQHLPYWYTLFYEAERTGVPVMRPLWYEFPRDEVTFTEEMSYMVGSGMLVHPVVGEGTTSVTFYLPQGVWYDKDTLVRHEGGREVEVVTPIHKIPVLYRGGHIVARRERRRRSASLSVDDPYTLYVMLDEVGEARGTLYHDDGTSYNYQRGKHIYRRFTYTGGVFTSTSMDGGVTMETRAFIERLILVGLPHGGGRPSKIVSHLAGGEEQQLIGFNLDARPDVLIVRKPVVGLEQGESTISFTF